MRYVISVVVIYIYKEKLSRVLLFYILKEWSFDDVKSAQDVSTELREDYEITMNALNRFVILGILSKRNIYRRVYYYKPLWECIFDKDKKLGVVVNE